jgi:hypothetical protein
MNTHSRRIAAFHTTRANAARSAIRHAEEDGNTAAAAAWQAVLDAHETAAANPTDENSDAAEDAHTAANRNHPPA